MIDPDEYWVEPEAEDLVSKAAALLDAGKIKALPPAWALDLRLTEKGGIPRTLEAATYCLERHPALSGLLAHDPRRGVVARATAPWGAAPGVVDREWLRELGLWAARELRVTWPTELIAEATKVVAARNKVAANEIRLDSSAPLRTPLEIAGAFLEANYRDHDGALLLRRWRGDWFVFGAAGWERLARQKLLAEIAAWSAQVSVLTADARRVPWAPSWRAIEDIESLLCAHGVLVPDEVEPPARLDFEATARDLTWSFAAANGLVDLRNGELEPHTPGLFALNSSPVSWEPGAACPRWFKFLDEIWPGDSQTQECLQEFFGYCLGSCTSFQKIGVFRGARRGGKSTIARVLQALLGEGACGIGMRTLGSNFGPSALLGKKLAVIADARLGPRDDAHAIAERLLAISGEDKIAVDRKYREPLSVRLPTRLLIVTNELLELPDVAGALASRLLVFMFHKSFEGHEDFGLEERLETELAGIAAWAAHGARRLCGRGYFLQPPGGQEDLAEAERLNSPIRVFIEEECELGETLEVECRVLWQAFVTRRVIEGARPPTLARFSADLRAALPGLRVVRPWAAGNGARPRLLKGVGLRSPRTAEHADWQADCEESP